MTYEKIFSRFYQKETDPSLFKMQKEDAYAKMVEWLHSVSTLPHIRKCFNSLVFDDEVYELTYELNTTSSEKTDDDFVTEIFAQGMVICWMSTYIDKNVNLAAVIGGKEEKAMLNNYKSNIARLNSLELKLVKFINSYDYSDNDYVNGEV